MPISMKVLAPNINLISTLLGGRDREGKNLAVVKRLPRISGEGFKVDIAIFHREGAMLLRACLSGRQGRAEWWVGYGETLWLYLATVIDGIAIVIMWRNFFSNEPTPLEQSCDAVAVSMKLGHNSVR
ncbi:hypothetical protein EVAR_84698_1 [Eumeta japonica]|uniref:Uncharacterized protein n=1 Tax=Eumeta variegata TaxID=151549 RepID=A0A4C1VU60_EUMVA|nr:hypothetical protein EVAR_84698_1 [Eumeta japonica]